MVAPALAAADLLARQGIAATVVNARFVKPLDADCLLEIARRVRLVVTVEENALAGGFGSAVQELFTAEGLNVALRPLGIPDLFVGQGPRAVLLARLGLSPSGIVTAVTSALRTQLPANIATQEYQEEPHGIV